MFGRSFRIWSLVFRPKAFEPHQNRKFSSKPFKNQKVLILSLSIAAFGQWLSPVERPACGPVQRTYLNSAITAIGTFHTWLYPIYIYVNGFFWKVL